jgi:hypothetical protein
VIEYGTLNIDTQEAKALSQITISTSFATGMQAERMTNMEKELTNILEKAEISQPLREAVEEMIDAWRKNDSTRFYELSSVKSYISNIKHEDECSFWEDHERNEKILGESVYQILDRLHHFMAYHVGKIPSGMVIYDFDNGKIEEKSQSVGDSKTLSLIREEHRKSLKRASNFNDMIRERNDSRIHEEKD